MLPNAVLLVKAGKYPRYSCISAKIAAIACPPEQDENIVGPLVLSKVIGWPPFQGNMLFGFQRHHFEQESQRVEFDRMGVFSNFARGLCRPPCNGFAFYGCCHL